MKVLVTGAAGFIGMHVAKKLLERGDQVLGIDNLNDYYDPALKLARLNQLNPYDNFNFEKIDISDRIALDKVFAKVMPDCVVHLAAQAGVRYSIQNPEIYVQSNLVGFGHILEACRRTNVKHLVYASSSSVYGANTSIPFKESDSVDHPVSLYAATKKANELMAHTYSHLFALPTTGLRFFTVYGPWGRPDMSPWLFTSAILEGKPIDVFNYGRMKRDFTYIDDISEGVIRVMDSPPTLEHKSQLQNPAPYRIFNIGNDQPVELLTYIETIERSLGKAAKKNLLPMQLGDVVATWADVSELRKAINYVPKTSLENGVGAWVRWYLDYSSIKSNISHPSN
ncbi:MAG: NAD-dependent epimerase [Sulfuritalea sp.]|nr:NAD-dependent epimerase [Sulfuritalea sp.]